MKRPCSEDCFWLESEAEAHVGNEAVAAQVRVPAVVPGGKPQLCQATFQDLETVLTLGPAHLGRGSAQSRGAGSRGGVVSWADSFGSCSMD